MHQINKRFKDLTPRIQQITFDFGYDETFIVEKIIRATFLNPQRKTFKECQNFWGNFCINGDNQNADSLIRFVQNDMPNSVKKFNAKQFKLFDSSFLDSDARKRWLSDLETMGWYGPFKFLNQGYFFQTASFSGTFHGFCLGINLQNKYVNFVRIDKYNRQCGALFLFSNQ